MSVEVKPPEYNISVLKMYEITEDGRLLTIIKYSTVKMNLLCTLIWKKYYLIHFVFFSTCILFFLFYFKVLILANKACIK